MKAVRKGWYAGHKEAFLRPIYKDWLAHSQGGSTTKKSKTTAAAYCREAAEGLIERWGTDITQYEAGDVDPEPYSHVAANAPRSPTPSSEAEGARSAPLTGDNAAGSAVAGEGGDAIPPAQGEAVAPLSTPASAASGPTALAPVETQEHVDVSAEAAARVDALENLRTVSCDYESRGDLLTAHDKGRAPTARRCAGPPSSRDLTPASEEASTQPRAHEGSSAYAEAMLALKKARAG
jgi:hypothetical protein